MKMAASSVTIDRDNITTDVSFKIKASGKAFKILSDTLYTDKPKAILRELSCNAYDAHVAAGKKDVPFLVKLPTQMSPNLVIRDYGIGLSHEDVVTIATTYFESTKTESNDFVGALGLGSKSPFSYVDSYTITSYFNGVRRIYCAFIDSDDTPKITLMNGQMADANLVGAETKEDGETTLVKIDGMWWAHGEFTGEKSDEPNGLEISVPVKSGDFATFHGKAREVFTYFDVRPTTIPALTYSDEKIILKGTNWSVHQAEQNYYSRSVMNAFVAIQGNVAYPIDIAAIPRGQFDGATINFMLKIQDLSRDRAGGSVVMKFPIGSLDVAASREGLSYKKTTFAAIEDQVKVVMAEMTKEAQVIIDALPSAWDAMVHVHHKFNTSILSSVTKSLTYGGKKLEDRVTVPTTTLEKFLSLKVKQSYRSTFSEMQKSSSLVFYPYYNEKNVIIIKDTKDALRRIKNDSTVSDLTVYLLEQPKDDINNAVSLKTLIADLQGIKVINASELADPPKVVRVGGAGKKNTTVGDARRAQILEQMSVIKPDRIEVDFDAGGVYAVNEAGSLKYGESSWLTSYAQHIYHLFSVSSETMPTIVVPYVADLKKYKEADNWVEISEYIDEKVKDPAFQKTLTFDAPPSHLTFDSDSASVVGCDMFRLLATKKAKTNPEFTSTLNAYNKYQTIRYNGGNTNVKAAIKHFGITLQQDNTWLEEAIASAKKISDSYPMLRVISNLWYAQNFVNLVAQYVTDMDQLKSLTAKPVTP